MFSSPEHDHEVAALMTKTNPLSSSDPLPFSWQSIPDKEFRMTLKPTRRGFLQKSMAFAATGLVYETSLAKTKTAPLIDTHLHCFAGDKDSRFPYHKRAPYRPEQSATPEHLLTCMDGAGVDFAVVVHPEPYQDDHRYLEHCLKTGNGRLKGSMLLFSDRDGSLEKMPDLVKRLDVVTARVHAYAPGRLPPFGKPELKRLWRMASELNLAVQLHFEPRYASGFEPLIREFRDTRVIIDHLGRPFQGTPKEHAVVMEWAKLPNTVMKLSSIPSERSYPHRDIRPIIRNLTDAFGASRMIYGGGFNADATPESYQSAFARARSYIDHLSESEQAQILGGTAAKLYGFGE
ncbi:MAG: putative TIM-barrel fold metal-dependent hydrolase [Planctomycetaceae bacterium]|jgi:predicted TIM-barrel fold metal-dependent hydrolase